MNSKINADKKAIALKTKRESADVGLKRAVQPASRQNASHTPSRDVLYLDNCSTTVQVTVKTAGRKRTSTMVSGSTTNQKVIEEKKKAGDNVEASHNWGRLLSEQNRVAMKQNLQYATRTQTSKSTRQSTTEAKEARKSLEVHRSHRYELGVRGKGGSRRSPSGISPLSDHQVAGKHLDEIPVKQESGAKKSSDRIKTVIPSSVIPSSTSIASSMESILVVDRAVQCGGIFDGSNDRFGVFNPVRTLGFLMKELEGLVRDDRSSKILSEMEHALLRIPPEPGKPAPADVDAIALRAHLEASTAKLESTSQKLNATCESLREQRDSLQQQVQKQAILMEEARQREAELEGEVEKLQNRLEDAKNSASSAQKTIDDLKEESKRLEALQKINADLRSELNDQIELAQQRFMEAQYLKLEKEKLVVLSDYKDSQLVEHRVAVKELQNLINEQLMGLRETYKDTGDCSNRHNSMLHRGRAHSSPTPSSSDHSNVVQSWHGLSDISLSTVEQNVHSSGGKKSSPEEEKDISFHGEMAGDSERKRPLKDVETQLEFISLPGEETLLTMSLPIQKGDEAKQHGNTGIGDEGEPRNLVNIADTITEIDKPISADEMDGNGGEKRDENGVRSLYKSRKSSFEKTRKHRSSKERNKSVVRDNFNPTKEFSPSNPIDISIKEQFQTIFRDMRQQSRIPVNIPSPPRHYPHPDWSDSSLPSISGLSESNIV